MRFSDPRKYSSPGRAYDSNVRKAMGIARRIHRLAQSTRTLGYCYALYKYRGLMVLANPKNESLVSGFYAPIIVKLKDSSAGALLGPKREDQLQKFSNSVYLLYELGVTFPYRILEKLRDSFQDIKKTVESRQ